MFQVSLVFRFGCDLQMFASRFYLVKRFVMTLLKSRWCSSHRSPSLKRFWQCYMMFFFANLIETAFTSGRPKNPRIFPQNSSKHEFFFKVRRWLPPGYYCQIPPGFMEGLSIPYQNISPNRKKGWRDDGGSQPVLQPSVILRYAYSEWWPYI